MEILKDIFTQLLGEPYLPETAITGITLAIVQFAKSKGLKTAAAPALSVCVAMVLGVLNALVAGKPWTDGIAPGFVIGLTASGSYSYIKALAGKKTDKPVGM